MKLLIRFTEMLQVMGQRDGYLNCTSCIMHMGSMAKGICISLNRASDVNASKNPEAFP